MLKARTKVAPSAVIRRLGLRAFWDFAHFGTSRILGLCALRDSAPFGTLRAKRSYMHAIHDAACGVDGIVQPCQRIGISPWLMRRRSLLLLSLDSRTARGGSSVQNFACKRITPADYWPIHNLAVTIVKMLNSLLA